VTRPFCRRWNRGIRALPSSTDWSARSLSGANPSDQTNPSDPTIFAGEPPRRHSACAKCNFARKCGPRLNLGPRSRVARIQLNQSDQSDPIIFGGEPSPQTLRPRGGQVRSQVQPGTEEKSDQSDPSAPGDLRLCFFQFSSWAGPCRDGFGCREKSSGKLGIGSRKGDGRKKGAGAGWKSEWGPGTESGGRAGLAGGRRSTSRASAFPC
jgi:hypothetical protein